MNPYAMLNERRLLPEVNVLSALEWLLESDDASLRYRTLVELMGENKNDEDLKIEEEKMRSQYMPGHLSIKCIQTSEGTPDLCNA